MATMALPERLDLNEALKTPDDLKKIPTLKAEVVRRKAIVDEQVRQKRDEMHAITQKGMSSLSNAQQISNMIREEMMNIERLGSEAQALISNFPKIRDVATLHRNFQAVEKMKLDLESFQDRLEVVNQMLVEDKNDYGQPNLLKVHYELSQLREIRDEALDQAKRAPDLSCESTLQGIFKGLDDAVDDFNENLGDIMANMIQFASRENEGVIVRMAVIIVNEEKRDDQIRERKLVRDEYSDLATRFKSLAVGDRQPREYKKMLLDSVRLIIASRLEETNDEFMQDPDKLEKLLKWYYNDLNIVRRGIVDLVPKDWKIYDAYVGIYHQQLHDWLLSKVTDSGLLPTHMLAIIHYKQTYLDKMRRLGKSRDDLVPDLPGGHDSDLVREYQKLIVDKVDQWMSRINSTDLQALRARRVDEIEPNEYEHFRSKSSNELWFMLNEQLSFANGSGIVEITEGVVGSMIGALEARKEAFTRLISDISDQMKHADFNRERAEHLFDWFIAIANDGLAYFGEENAENPGKIEAFKDDCKNVVRSEFALPMEARFETLKDGYLDLVLLCMTSFVKLIYTMDLRPATSEILTAAWISPGQQVPAILEALSSYLEDYLPRSADLLRVLLVQEMAKRLLGEYLSAVRNRGAKYRRQDPFTDRVRQDLQDVFKLFGSYPDAFQEIKDSWRAVNGMVQLLECEKGDIPREFEQMLADYPDIKIGWVESVLRAREDIDWGPIGGDGKSTMKMLRAIAVDKRPDTTQQTIFAFVD